MGTLITGATGFVGLHVTRLLAEQTKAIRVLVRPTSERRFIQDLPVEFVEGDLRDRPSLAKALDGITHVFHVAADYRLWSKNPGELYENNVQGTRNLIEAAHNAGIERFIYTSTVGTVAVPGWHGLPDERTLATVSDMIGDYKKSKLLAEQEVLDAAARRFPAVIVNPTTPVGPCDWKPTPTGRLIVDFARGRVFAAPPPGGTNLVAVEDVARAHVLALERGRPGERYLIGGDNLSLDQVWQLLAEVTGRPAPRWRIPYALAVLMGWIDEGRCRIQPRAQPRVPLEGVRMSVQQMYVDSSKARTELGYQPGPIRDGLKRAVAWYRAHGYA